MERTADTVVPPRDLPGRSLLVRVLRGIGWASLVAGFLVLGFVVQQLVVTTWIADRNQGALTAQAREHFATAAITEVPIEQVEHIPAPSVPATEDLGEASPRRIDPVPAPAGPKTLLVEERPERHRPFAIIRIPKVPKLAEGWTVVEGVSLRDLKNGAGHMPKTALPGQPGNAVISGHRTTHGAPFYDLDVLVPGDRIEVETALGTHVYEVRDTMIVKPTDLWVTNPRDGSWLTLTTCNPRFSSRQRLVVVAELVAGPNYEAIYR